MAPIILLLEDPCSVGQPAILSVAHIGILLEARQAAALYHVGNAAVGCAGDGVWGGGDSTANRESQ